MVRLKAVVPNYDIEVLRWCTVVCEEPAVKQQVDRQEQAGNIGNRGLVVGLTN